MKIKSHGGFFRAVALLAPVVALPLILGGCMSASLEDAAPAAALRTPPVVPQPAPRTAATPSQKPTPGAPTPGALTAGAPTPGANVTGAYPDLNVPPASATAPIAPSEKDALMRDLTATRQRLENSAPANNADAEARRLRNLAKTHAERQLQEIEKTE